MLSISMINLQKERLNILVKELYHIRNILDFFEANKSKKKSKQTHMMENIKYIKHDLNEMSNNIKNLKKLLDNLIHKVSTTEDKNNITMFNHNNVLFLIKLNYSKLKIEEFLKVISVIYNKMRQLFNENLTQYIPYPTIGRRYSNNSLVIYLEKNFRNIFDNLVDIKNKKKLIFNWDYKSDFTYRRFYSPEISKKQVGSYNFYIDLPYSYYELAYLLPSVTYNIIHIIIKNELNNNLIKQYNTMFTKIKKEVVNKSNLMNHVYDLMGHDKYLKDLLLDIFSDKIAYKIHKDSYIFTLAHQALGEGLADSFFSIENNNLQQKQIYNIVVNEWDFNHKKDHIILRLWLLLSYRKDKENEEILNLKEYLATLIDLNDANNYVNNKKDSFEYIYQNNHPNFYESYRSVKIYLQMFYEFFKKQNINLNLDIENKNVINILNKCWENRFQLIKQNNIVTANHPTNFRVKLHKNLSAKREFYTLRLIKIRKDSNDFDIYKCENELVEQENFLKTKNDSNSSNNKQNSNINENTEATYNFSAYGIYDFINLREVKQTFNLDSQYDRYSYKQNENKKVNFFESKYILFRLDTNGIKKEDLQKLPSDRLGAMINIVLTKDSKNDNGYENLQESCKEIEQVLEKNKNIQYMMLKSLGPEDLVILVFNITPEETHKLSLDLYDTNYIHRTFTIIIKPFKDKSNAKVCRKNFADVNIVSYIRLKENNTLNKQNNRIVSTTGIMDKKIIWKQNTTLEDINNFYIQNKNKISDYYTHFEIIEK